MPRPARCGAHRPLTLERTNSCPLAERMVIATPGTEGFTCPANAIRRRPLRRARSPRRGSDVLCLSTLGFTNAQLVERTALSINSIKSKIRSCYRRIGVDSRSRAVLRGVDHGMQLDRVGLSEPDIPGSNS